MPIRVAIIEDEQIIIDGLVALLGQHEDIQVIGTATDSEGAKALIEEQRPQVVLMDLNFPAPEPDGIRQMGELLARWPSLMFLMLTSYDDITLIKEALRCGAMGYVLKNIDKEELIIAIQTVAAQKRYLDSYVRDIVINALLEEDQKNQAGGELPHPLTERELEISRLIADGKKRKEIADQLFISVNTVDTHLKNAFGKLEVKNAAELIQRLSKYQLI